MSDCADGIDTEPLPPLYERWVGELLGGGVPRETEATCSDCAMCSPSAPEGDATHFHPNVKCCSHVPVLANYLVGRILQDHGAVAGRASTLARIRARAAVTPLGLGRPRAYSALSREGGPESFGRSRALLCPHYQRESDDCGIWKHRDAVCSTWFCKHVRGAVGFTFWSSALRPLLSAVEIALARWCVVEIGVGERALARLFAPPSPERAGREIDGVVDEEAYGAVWGDHRGREEELFVDCARRVEPLRWSDVLTIGGSELRARAEVARNAYRRLLSTDLPSHVRAAPIRILEGDRDRVHLATYTEFDSIDVPRALLDVLPRFDGRAMAEVVEELARDGTEIDAEMLRTLVDFGILETPRK